MKQTDVVLGSTYVVKVSGRLVPVRLEVTNPYGGWDGRNLATGRVIRIRTAAKLRRVFTPKVVEPPKIERDEWLRVNTTSEERALAFFGQTRETADVRLIEPATPVGGLAGDAVAVFGVRLKTNAAS